MADRIPVTLGGVAETALWTLHHRALEARRPDTVLPDPWAVELVDRLDLPWERFGTSAAQAQAQALRSRCFDQEVAAFLDRHPGGTVVGLGEGLETRSRRVDRPAARWLAVDVPEVAAVREEVLPGDERHRTVAGSALDLSWADAVDPGADVLLTAQGLLMYLPLDDALGLVAACARRFPGAALLFDVVPAWISRLTRRGEVRSGDGYRPPPWPWGLDRHTWARLARADGVAALARCHRPRGRGVLFRWVLPAVDRTPGLRVVPPFPVILVARCTAPRSVRPAAGPGGTGGGGSG